MIKQFINNQIHMTKGELFLEYWWIDLISFILFILVAFWLTKD